MTSQFRILRSLTRPIGQPLRGSRVLSRESVRRVVRSYFVSSGFTSELVLGMPCAGSVPTSKPGRPQEDHFRANTPSSRLRPAHPADSPRMRRERARKKTKGVSHRCETPRCAAGPRAAPWITGGGGAPSGRGRRYPQRAGPSKRVPGWPQRPGSCRTRCRSHPICRWP
jgi:hypothetical protein